MNKLTFLFAAVTLAAAVAPADAATISVSRRGIDCQLGYNEGQASYYEDGALYSDSTGWWRTALCPLHVDVANETGYSYTRFNFNVFDRHYSMDVSCRRVSYSVYGGVSWGPAVSSVGTSPQPQTLSVEASVGDVMLCYLPPVYQGNRSAILSYGNTITPH